MRTASICGGRRIAGKETVKRKLGHTVSVFVDDKHGHYYRIKAEGQGR